jgi:hypothetical protein
MRFFNWLTGGRPMKKICYCFTDAVSGRCVFLWEDAGGFRWMAEGAWSRFRVPARHGPEIWIPLPRARVGETVTITNSSDEPIKVYTTP